MFRLARTTSIVVVSYLLAWLGAYVLLVGFEPRLIPEYFMLGWSFTGLELAMSVWLFAWPLFVVILLAFRFIRRRLLASRGAPPNNSSKPTPLRGAA
jgi:hypothetical protein